MASLDFRTLAFIDPPAKTIDDYRTWPTRSLERQLPIEEAGQEACFSEDEWFAHADALILIRRVLSERGYYHGRAA